jgi:hypothetical protein
MAWKYSGIHAIAIMFSACMAVAIMVGCSSAPEPQPEPSKKEIRQDADRFFQKMGQEEGKTPSSP